MSRVLYLALVLMFALPACAENLQELEQARQQAVLAHSRVTADLRGKEAQLKRQRDERKQQSERVKVAEKNYKEAWQATKSLRRSQLDDERQKLRTISDELIKLTQKLKTGRTLEQARRLRLISALRAYTDRLFEVAERALSLKPARKPQADAMIKKAVPDLEHLEDLEQATWVKQEPPILLSFESETAGKSLKELEFLTLFYRELTDEAQREERKLAPEHTRLSQRLRRLNSLAQRGVAAPRLPVLIQRTRDALGKADDVISSFRAIAESYGSRVKELEALVAERSLNQARRPEGEPK